MAAIVPVGRRLLTLLGTVLLVAVMPGAVFAALIGSAWVGGPDWDRFLVGAVIGYLVGIAAQLFLPLRVVADGVARRLGAAAADGAVRVHEVSAGRASNVAEEIAIALGVPAGRVALIDTVVPNVLALPTSRGALVVVTRGALGLMTRDELGALVASQLAVASSPLVRVASRAQLVESVALPALFVASFSNPVILPVVVLAIGWLGRRADATRDLLADIEALAATRFPDALVGAFEALRPAALVAASQRLASAGFVVDPFAVLSARGRTTTTVVVNGRRRSWSTEDEVALELHVRAERIARAAAGDPSAMRGLGPWRRAWRALDAGGPFALTEIERAKAAELRAALLGDLPPPGPLPPMSGRGGT